MSLAPRTKKKKVTLLELRFDIPVDALVTASIRALSALTRTRPCFDLGSLCKIPLAMIKFRASTEQFWEPNQIRISIQNSIPDKFICGLEQTMSLQILDYKLCKGCKPTVLQMRAHLRSHKRSFL